MQMFSQRILRGKVLFGEGVADDCLIGMVELPIWVEGMSAQD